MLYLFPSQPCLAALLLFLCLEQINAACLPPSYCFAMGNKPCNLLPDQFSCTGKCDDPKADSATCCCSHVVGSGMATTKMTTTATNPGMGGSGQGTNVNVQFDNCVTSKNTRSDYGLPTGACCTSGGQCASQDCDYATWKCRGGTGYTQGGMGGSGQGYATTMGGSHTTATAAYPAGTCGAHMWGKYQHGSKCGNREPYDHHVAAEDAYLRTKYADDAMSCCKPVSTYTSGMGGSSGAGYTTTTGVAPAGTTFHVSDPSMTYDDGLVYCRSKGMTLAAIYNTAELAAARSAIQTANVQKAITAAWGDANGYRWFQTGSLWKDTEFPRNTGKVTDNIGCGTCAENHMYSLRGTGDFVWDSDQRSEIHPVLCRSGGGSSSCSYKNVLSACEQGGATGSSGYACSREWRKEVMCKPCEEEIQRLEEEIGHLKYQLGIGHGSGGGHGSGVATQTGGHGHSSGSGSGNLWCHGVPWDYHKCQSCPANQQEAIAAAQTCKPAGLDNIQCHGMPWSFWMDGCKACPPTKQEADTQRGVHGPCNV